MNIHEHQAKEILKKYGMPVLDGKVITSKDNIESVISDFNSNIYVVKAQIHAGGRGKAGGVKVTFNKDDAIKEAIKMWDMNLVTHQTGKEGQQVRRIYVESGCDIKDEYYISAVLDRSSKSIIFVVSKEGGVDIEEVASSTPNRVLQVKIDYVSGLSQFHIRKIAKILGFDKNLQKQLNKVVNSIYNVLISKDADQIEINPLVSTKDGNLLALDAKVSFDDNALYRNDDILSLRDKSEEDELEIKAQEHSLNYVKMDGEIGCMVNGAGLAMATMDIIKLYGKSPANFLDVGGSATTERVTEAFKIILSDKSVKAILVNIFGGIMRCDIIANGIVQAAKDIKLNIPLVVRLAGTNFELGKEILNNSGLEIIAADDLKDAAQKVVNTV